MASDEWLVARKARRPGPFFLTSHLGDCTVATEKQIRANQRNARLSTGPKTEKGRSRSRTNALKHGRSAKLVLPVLPQEDPGERALRDEQWFFALAPTNQAERALVRRGGAAFLGDGTRLTLGDRVPFVPGAQGRHARHRT